MRSPPEPWLCRTALQVAAYGGQTAVIESQLAAGVEVDETDERGKTALMFAAVNGHLAAVQQLLKAGADVNRASRIDVSTALLYAAKRGHTEVVDALLAAGASPNAMSRDGQFPLTVACAEDHVEIVEKLIATGADINQPAQNGDSDECAGFTPLIYATQVDSEGPLHSEGTDIMQLLLAAGANVDGVDAAGYTALMYACKWGSLYVIDLLLAAGADMRRTTNYGGTPIHSVANTLSGDTAEHVATVASIVIAEGVDIDAVNTFGYTALATAMRNGNAVLAGTILSAGATVNLGVDSPLFIAARYGVTDVVLELIEAGADVNHHSSRDMTPLMAAACQGCAVMVRLLLQAFADKDAVDAYGETALMNAERYRRTEAAEVIRNYGNQVVFVLIRSPVQRTKRIAQTWDDRGPKRPKI